MFRGCCWVISAGVRDEEVASDGGVRDLFDVMKDLNDLKEQLRSKDSEGEDEDDVQVGLIVAGGDEQR